MKILYAIQATGNGHISRASQIIPPLQNYGMVDVFLSGDNHTLALDYPTKYVSKGLSLRWKDCGSLDTMATLKCFEPLRLRRDIRQLPVENYDLVINDFEYIAARACKSKNVPTIHVGHQASFLSQKTPRHHSKSIIGEYIFKNYAPAPKAIGLHFDEYDQNILSPIIREDIMYAKPSDQGHITIYLPGVALSCFTNLCAELPHLDFHIFSPAITQNHQKNNIHFYKPSIKHFSASMIHAAGVITGGGFETPAEALFLNKKLIAIPIDRHYEQQCNAAALKLKGVTVLNHFNQLDACLITNWLGLPSKQTSVKATTVPNLIKKVMDTYWLTETSANVTPMFV